MELPTKRITSPPIRTFDLTTIRAIVPDPLARVRRLPSNNGSLVIGVRGGLFHRGLASSAFFVVYFDNSSPHNVCTNIPKGQAPSLLVSRRRSNGQFTLVFTAGLVLATSHRAKLTSSQAATMYAATIALEVLEGTDLAANLRQVVIVLLNQHFVDWITVKVWEQTQIQFQQLEDLHEVGAMFLS